MQHCSTGGSARFQHNSPHGHHHRYHEWITWRKQNLLVTPSQPNLYIPSTRTKDTASGNDSVGQWMPIDIKCTKSNNFNRRRSRRINEFMWTHTHGWEVEQIERLFDSTLVCWANNGSRRSVDRRVQPSAWHRNRQMTFEDVGKYERYHTSKKNRRLLCVKPVQSSIDTWDCISTRKRPDYRYPLLFAHTWYSLRWDILRAYGMTSVACTL